MLPENTVNICFVIWRSKPKFKKVYWKQIAVIFFSSTKNSRIQFCAKFISKISSASNGHWWYSADRKASIFLFLGLQTRRWVFRVFRKKIKLQKRSFFSPRQQIFPSRKGVSSLLSKRHKICSFCVMIA